MDSPELVFKYFDHLSKHQKIQCSKLGKLYTAWNNQINVISRKDLDNLYEKHVLHSLAIAKVISFKKDTKIIDVGTGGGFPGIPLAIMFPDSHFHLVDSIGKKTKVVKEIIRAINLNNVEVEQIRAENVNGKYDFIISRAVTRMKTFHSWVSKNISRSSFNDIQNGILYLKGGDLNEEMKEVKRPYTTFELNQFYSEEFFESKKVIYLPF